MVGSGGAGQPDTNTIRVTNKESYICLYIPGTFAGLQLRKSEQNGFHDNFLISQPNPMM